MTVCLHNVVEIIYHELILVRAVEKLKNFDINMAKGALKNTDIIPPPSFSHGDVPFTY